jgi:hypothetical protein
MSINPVRNYLSALDGKVLQKAATRDKVRQVYQRFDAKTLPAQRVGWRDPETQHTNFRVALDMVSQHVSLSECSLHDVGCGLGNLHDALIARGGVKSYLGSDFIESNILQARRDYPQNSLPYPAAHEVRDVRIHNLPDADITLCLGMLAFHPPKVVEALLHRMWRHTRRALCFTTWWQLGPGYDYHELMPELRWRVRAFLTESGGLTLERLGDYGAPEEACFLVLRAAP